ncbi:uncharacterized protein KGF55_000674 [Candida pseudojiufengensis]|uniref:uncharacterized protein n=1 Tax=Candida pseudojiufengensis TaxID=497109 RepID=UPI002224A40F|nr:uncharacterized protein KGF55_000674 [Candida pseudojiufengensis]KAI5966365.1 hypothetical protein KGF55_000674 [Candida pseudojiufengensis]
MRFGHAPPSHPSPTPSISLPNVRKLKRKRAPIIDDEEPKFSKLDHYKGILHHVIHQTVYNFVLSESPAYIIALVERVCKYKHAEMKELLNHIYKNIDDAFNKDFKHFSNLSYRDDFDSKDECENYVLDVLQKIMDSYQLWENKLNLLSKLFGYIDRNYLKIHSWKIPIKTYGIDKFYTFCFTTEGEEEPETSQLIFHYYSRLTGIYYKDKYFQKRHDSTKIQELFKKFTQMLSFNDWNRENYAFRISSAFDKQEGKGWFSSASEYQSSCYFQRILLVLYEEITYFSNYIQVENLLNDLIRELIIRKNWDDLLLDDLDLILEKPEEVKILKEICSDSLELHSIDGTLKLLHTYSNYAERLYKKALNDQSNMIQTIYEADEHIKSKILQYFKDDDRFEYESRKKLKSILEDKQINQLVTQQLIKFCDSTLKSKNKNKPNIDNLLSTVSTILTSLLNKDQFLKLYRKELSRRLLIGKSLDLNTEKSLIQLIEEIVGTDLDLMKLFEDINSSKTKHVLLNSKTIQLTLTTLKRDYWNDIPQEDFGSITLPPGYSNLLDLPEENKKFDWSNYKLHKLSITANFEGKEVTINCNLLQAAVILLFNDRDELLTNEITKLLNMNEKLLNSIIQTFNGTSHILILNDNKLTYNKKFKSKTGIVNLPIIKDYQQPTLNPIEPDQELTIESNQIISSNKRYEATIIKIMKKFRELSYSELLNKCFDNLLNSITLIDLKASIEKLIDQEYLKRKDIDTIVYIP